MLLQKIILFNQMIFMHLRTSDMYILMYVCIYEYVQYMYICLLALLNQANATK